MSSDDRAVPSERELLRTIVDKIPAMLAYWDSTLHCRFANQAYQRWFGVSPESLIGTHISKLLGPLYPLNRPYIEAALRGEPQEFEREIPDPSGGPPRRSLANYVPDVVDGVVRGFFVLVSDISAIKRAELALEESEAKFSGIDSERKRLGDERHVFVSLLENSSDFIGIADPSGTPIYLNPAGRRMVGLSADYPVEKTRIPEYYPADERAFAADVIVKSMTERGHWSGETWFRNWQTEERIPVSDEHFTIHDQDTGRVLGFGTVTRNISEARRIAREREDLLMRAQQAREQVEAANEHLRESEERFRLTIDEAPIGMALVAPDGRFLRVNRVLCEILGYQAEELSALTFQKITHAEDLDADLALAGRLARGEIPRYQLAKRYIRKDGTIVDTLLSGSAVRDRTGAPVYYIAQIEDVTERKRLEDRLRVAEAKSSGILSISADAIISIDEQQHITMFNEGAERVFGYSRAEAVGSPLDILIPERFRAVHRQHVERFANGREVARRMGERGTVITGLRKNREEFPADAAISKLEIAGTRVLTVALRDISEQKRIESEQRFLAEVGPVLATSLDYEETLTRVAELAVRDLADLCIVDVVEDDEWVRRLKVASRDPSKAWLCEMLTRIPLDRRRPHLLHSVLETRQPLLMQRPSAETIASLAQSEEHHRALRALDIHSMAAVPLRAHGKVMGAIAFVSSTASRVYGPADVRLAEELAQRAALSIENARLYRAARRATQARDDVLGIVAHDLRNPLNSIVMHAQLLRRPTEEQERGSYKPSEAILRAANRMNRLIEDLLDVTRMEAGRLSVDQARVPPRTVLSECVEAQRSLAASASLEFRIDVAADLPEVWADRDRLLQVFENLIGNAVKFTKPGGCITVGAKPRDAEVLFWVSDTGSGIPAEDLPHLFDRFWQARKAERRGAGLGLPIVRGVVEAHCGRIWVESTPGQGSTFFFTIPTANRVEAWRMAPAHHRP